MATKARKTVKIGNTPGGRGPLPANIRTQSDYYNSGLSSALNPGGKVINTQGTVLNKGAKS